MGVTRIATQPLPFEPGNRWHGLHRGAHRRSTMAFNSSYWSSPSASPSSSDSTISSSSSSCKPRGLLCSSPHKNIFVRIY